jgi:carboxyl-terminal processing protease
VQNVIDLEDGRSVLKLTTAAYRRPSGKNIHRFPNSKESDEWGVSPDQGYVLKLGDSELMDMVRQRRLRDIVQPHARVVASAAAAKSGAQATVAAVGEGERAKPAKAARPSGQPAAKPAAAVKKTPAAATVSDKPAGAAKPSLAEQTGRGVVSAEDSGVDRQLQLALKSLSKELAQAESK